jgi:hypothetical protein
MTDATLDTVIARALDAYAGLGDVGEAIDDEWTYVDELSTAWREHLEEVVATRAGEELDASTVAAVDRLIEEVALIEDPHRAIDWLSTFPQVVLVAIGGST